MNWPWAHRRASLAGLFPALQPAAVMREHSETSLGAKAAWRLRKLADTAGGPRPRLDPPEPVTTTG